MLLVYVILILFMGNIDPSRSDGWCQDSEYSCDDGTQCRPKAERCQNRTDCDRPLPVEPPLCPQQCQEGHESWCEERGECINNNEVCDCGPNKVYCVSGGMYSCENRRGIASSSIFSICKDGGCSSKCTGSSRKGCRDGQFECGSSCKDISQVIKYRNCSGECIAAENLCYRVKNIPSESPDEPNSSSSSGTIAALIIIPLVLLSLGIFLYKNSNGENSNSGRRNNNDSQVSSTSNDPLPQDSSSSYNPPPQASSSTSSSYDAPPQNSSSSSSSSHNAPPQASTSSSSKYNPPPTPPASSSFTSGCDSFSPKQRSGPLSSYCQNCGGHVSKHE